MLEGVDACIVVDELIDAIVAQCELGHQLFEHVFQFGNLGLGARIICLELLV